MDIEQAHQLVEMIWNMYDKDASGELDRSELVKLFKDISKVV
jgi:hypothetical protein